MLCGVAWCMRQAIANMLRVRTLVQQHIAKIDEERTTDFLYAASKGDASKIRQAGHRTGSAR
jgi:hypothetical protein